ncbi:MAG TPA: macro domain-containing protein [Bryobacteraceae bacterium]|nr:macro domain-containing protein [Bryobacteraceae bacterium]
MVLLMIKFHKGNVLDAPVEALVNTVNTVGVMGKGIALMFKEAFPENFRAYEEACKRGDVRIGRMFVTESSRLDGPRWIINFPSKQHWRQPSKLEWIREGLADLRRVVVEKGIRSLALPPLGCGNGGLDWAEVRPEIERVLASLNDVEVLVFEPTQKYQNVAKPAGVQKLTPARAMIAEMVWRYWVVGSGCTYLEVQKLGWFLERTINRLTLPNPFKLQFTADKYGPYSDRLRHLLNGLDGSYLHCDKRLSDAEPSDTIWFDEGRRAFLELYLKQDEQRALSPVLDRTAALIDGFESPMGMELLATVDWLIDREQCEASVTAIRAGLARWPAGAESAERKLKLFNDRLIGLALNRLATAS